MNRRVLVVDDDEIFRMAVVRALDGFEVVLARSTEEADELVDTRELDCVLLDHHLPATTGLEYLPRLIEKGLGVVMLSEVGNETIAAAAMRGGCHDYLPKRDLDPLELRRRLEKAIERQHLQAELARTRQELETFSHVAAHDLKAPARQIHAFASLARESLERGDLAAVDLDLSRLETAANRIRALVMAMHRHTVVGEDPLELSSFDLDTVVDALFELVRAEAPEGSTFSRTPLPRVTADAVLLEQVLQNLLRNAVKFRGDAPLTVHVTGSVDDERHTIRVTDNGTGIPSGEQERIFAPLQRLVGAEIEGSGLGLATCRKIMNHHRGTIAVDSEVGRGSTFILTWPTG